MFKAPRKLMLLALLCGVLFIVGMVQLFLLRFEAGNVYPAYSSLRTDPLGTRALFESLQRASKHRVDRNFRFLDQAELGVGKTLLIIGTGDRSFNWGRKKYEKLLENLAQSGGRLVLTFTPSSRHPTDPLEEDAEKASSETEADAEDEEPIEGFVEPEETDDETSCFDESDSWNGMHTLGFRFGKPAEEPLDDYAVRFVKGPDLLPLTIPWRAPLSFTLRDNSWETLYTWQDEPVVVRRPWGKGVVVMVADSYLLSNEALRNHRFPGLLTWLVKPGNDIIFDEYLKGLIKQPGMAGLARQYRLHWVFAALLVVVCLFVWRQSAIFISPVQEERKPAADQPAAGIDTSQGLVHLAGQHIEAKSLLTVCFQAWKAQAARRVSETRIAEVQAMVQEAAADPRKEIQVKTYIAICELLKQGKRS